VETQEERKETQDRIEEERKQQAEVSNFRRSLSLYADSLS
jgi:hypothetical protein